MSSNDPWRKFRVRLLLGQPCGKLAAFSILESAEINPSLTIWPSYRR
jgi:hypothetical protein